MLVMTVRRAASWRGETQGEGEREGGEGRGTVQLPNQGSDWEIGKMFSANQSSSSTYSRCWHRDGEKDGEDETRFFIIYKTYCKSKILVSLRLFHLSCG